jgi:hypothetical protein
MFLSCWKYDPQYLSRIRRLIFYPSRGQKSTGSRTRNTVGACKNDYGICPVLRLKRYPEDRVPVMSAGLSWVVGVVSARWN